MTRRKKTIMVCAIGVLAMGIFVYGLYTLPSVEAALVAGAFLLLLVGGSSVLALSVARDAERAAPAQPGQSADRILSRQVLLKYRDPVAVHARTVQVMAIPVKLFRAFRSKIAAATLRREGSQTLSDATGTLASNQES